MTMSAGLVESFRPPIPAANERPLGLLATLRALQRNPIEIWTRAHFDAPILVARGILGARAVVNDPAAIRRVFVDNVGNYRRDRLQMSVLRSKRGGGILVADGEAWRVQRRAMASLFSPRQVAGFAPAMRKVALSVVDDLSAARDTGAVDVLKLMTQSTLRMLEETLFSQGLSRDSLHFQQVVTEYFSRIGRFDLFDLVGAPAFLPRINRMRAKTATDAFENAIDDILSSRIALTESGVQPPKDLLTLLLAAQDPQTGAGMAREDVRANMRVFIVAGHETTAALLTWALYLLSQATAWREKVEAEIDAQFDPGAEDDPTPRLPLLRAVLEETMRLYPPLPMLSREAIADDVLGGHKIAGGTVVVVAPYLLHRHRTLWTNPDAFDPTRFLGAAREKIDRWAYLPFGAGPRVCIGAAFALQEASILLAYLLRAFRFGLAPGQNVMPLQRVTLKPRLGLLMNITARHRR